MDVVGMRWGYDGDKIACGPIDGNLIAEVMVADEKTHTYFVACTRFQEFYKVYVSPYPLFDLLMHLFDYGADFDYEGDKVDRISSEIYDYEMYDYPEEMMKSKFVNAIKLAHIAVDECPGEDGESFESAQEFIEKYLGEDVDKLEGLAFPEREELPGW